MGFGMALAQNTTALNYFSNLSEGRLKIIEGAKNVQSSRRCALMSAISPRDMTALSHCNESIESCSNGEWLFHGDLPLLFGMTSYRPSGAISWQTLCKKSFS